MTLNTAAAKHNYLHGWTDFFKLFAWSASFIFITFMALGDIFGFSFLPAFLFFCCMRMVWMTSLRFAPFICWDGGCCLEEPCCRAIRKTILLQIDDVQAACRWAPGCTLWTKRRFAQQLVCSSHRCASSAWFWTESRKDISWYDHRNGIYLSWGTSAAPTFSLQSRRHEMAAAVRDQQVNLGILWKDLQKRQMNSSCPSWHGLPALFLGAFPMAPQVFIKTFWWPSPTNAATLFGCAGGRRYSWQWVSYSSRIFSSSSFPMATLMCLPRNSHSTVTMQ